jgi:hypothetical protein
MRRVSRLKELSGFEKWAAFVRDFNEQIKNIQRQKWFALKKNKGVMYSLVSNFFVVFEGRNLVLKEK